MTIERRRFLRLAAASAALPLFPRATSAQSSAWPSRVMRVVVGFPPGGGADSATRIIAARLSELLSQQVVVENKPGAGGNIAHDLVAHAQPDGYSILFTPGSLPIMQVLYGSLSYDPIAD